MVWRVTGFVKYWSQPDSSARARVPGSSCDDKPITKGRRVGSPLHLLLDGLEDEPCLVRVAADQRGTVDRRRSIAENGSGDVCPVAGVEV